MCTLWEMAQTIREEEASGNSQILDSLLPTDECMVVALDHADRCSGGSRSCCFTDDMTHEPAHAPSLNGEIDLIQPGSLP